MAKRLLMIDDEEDMRVLAQVFLEMEGEFEVSVAESGAQGIAMAAQLSPAAILLDYMMPEMNGPETLAVLRSGERTKGIPVIFLTGKAHAAERSELEALGVAGIIAKPFSPEALASQVRMLLKI